MAPVVGLIVTVSIVFSVYEAVTEIRAERTQKIVERCPDFSSFEHWYGSYDESFWKIAFFGEPTENKVSEWFRGDYIAFGVFELSAYPLQKQLNLRWVRLFVRQGLRDISHRTVSEFNSRGFTCWRGVRYDGDFVIVDQFVYDHEMNDLYVITLFCDPDQETNEDPTFDLLSLGADWRSTQCEAELDSLFQGAGWHSLDRRLPFLAE